MIFSVPPFRTWLHIWKEKCWTLRFGSSLPLLSPAGKEQIFWVRPNFSKESYAGENTWPCVSSLPALQCCATRWIGISKLIFEHPHSTVSFHIFVYFVSPHRVCEWVVAVCALPLRKFMADHFVLPLSPQPFGLRSSSRKQALLLLLCSTLPLPKPLAGGGVFHSFFCSRKTRIFNPSYKLESTPKLMINN